MLSFQLFFDFSPSFARDTNSQKKHIRAALDDQPLGRRVFCVKSSSHPLGPASPVVQSLGRRVFCVKSSSHPLGPTAPVIRTLSRRVFCVKLSSHPLGPTAPSIRTLGRRVFCVKLSSHPLGPIAPSVQFPSRRAVPPSSDPADRNVYNTQYAQRPALQRSAMCHSI